MTDRASKDPQRSQHGNAIAFRIGAVWVLLLLLELMVFVSISDSQAYKWHVALGGAGALAVILLYAIYDDAWIESLRHRTSLAGIVGLGGCLLFAWPAILPSVRRTLTVHHYFFLGVGLVLMLLLAAFFSIRNSRR